MDSNHDKLLQRELCYHYTIGQRGGKLSVPQPDRQEKFTKPLHIDHSGKSLNEASGTYTSLASLNSAARPHRSSFIRISPSSGPSISFQQHFF